MRKARIFRLVVRLFLLTFTVSLSIVSALAGWSAVNILMNEDNIRVDMDNIVTHLDPSDIGNWYVYIPFNITNDGYFDLNAFTITISIDMYYNASYTESARILSHSTLPVDIRRGDTYPGGLNATNFNTIPVFDPGYTPYVLIDLILSGYYSLNLLSFDVVFENINYTIS
ncbi:MAG: hypothetical protein ACFFBP_03695 [Promethearchaeota archaeon]